MIQREYYNNSIKGFLSDSPQFIYGGISRRSEFSVETNQARAWEYEIAQMQQILEPYSDNECGGICFEYSIPRMGQRIDVLLILGPVIFVLEFKVGQDQYNVPDIDQVCDYALDLKNFHEASHDKYIIPVLIATEAKESGISIRPTPRDKTLLETVKCNSSGLAEVISKTLQYVASQPEISYEQWREGRYCPTPTIIESAKALYNGHSVENISRSDANAKNLSDTSKAVARIIEQARERSEKVICFVTGVPGAGKTLVGLNIANSHMDPDNELYSVFLSGNDPLVKVLREALTRDKVKQNKAQGKKITKKVAGEGIKSFIQNVHHFRDECLKDTNRPPIEHVTLFDEAQRAWTKEMTSGFMKRKKGIADFEKSEPEYLISCLARHSDWAVVVCLVGGGQEINTGEAGISEWINSTIENFPDWGIVLSPRLTDSEYGSGKILEQLNGREKVRYDESLHLSVSLRSFRAESVSLFVKQVLDLEQTAARTTLASINKYPIVLTRNLATAKEWIKSQARGSERFGMIVSSQAERLRPQAIHVKSPIDPIHYFLNGKDDVRSSYYMEDVATEFHVQGLELDWSCVVWDADFRCGRSGWQNWSFKGSKWQKINKPARKLYQKNAYRVLLTRARQGMVIVVPEGDENDSTRKPEYYDMTYEYLRGIGILEL